MESDEVVWETLHEGLPSLVNVGKRKLDIYHAFVDSIKPAIQVYHLL